MRGLGTAVGVGAVLVGHGRFESVVAVGFSSADADDDVVRSKQRSGDVPVHADAAAAGGFSAESTDGCIGNGRLSEFAAHQHHHTGWHNGAVVRDGVGKHLRAGINVGCCVVKNDPLARSVDVPQGGGSDVFGNDDRDGLVEHVVGGVGAAGCVVHNGDSGVGAGVALQLNRVVGRCVCVGEGRNGEFGLAVVVEAVLDFDTGGGRGGGHSAVPDEEVNFLGNLAAVRGGDLDGDGGVSDELGQNGCCAHRSAFVLGAGASSDFAAWGRVREAQAGTGWVVDVKGRNSEHQGCFLTDNDVAFRGQLKGGDDGEVVDDAHGHGSDVVAGSLINAALPLDRGAFGTWLVVHVQGEREGVFAGLEGFFDAHCTDR